METPISEPTLSPEAQQTPQDSGLNKLADFIADVLQQLSSLQSLMAERIGEIEELEKRAAELEDRCLKLEAFNKALKLRLRQSVESGI